MVVLAIGILLWALLRILSDFGRDVMKTMRGNKTDMKHKQEEIKD